MGISQALYTGVTGLSVNADGMSVIANNIANANGKGFKYDRAEFDDLLSVDMGSGGAQMGRGARLADVKTMHTQGGLAVTDNLTDLAIQGDGFFTVSNPNTEIEESGGLFFTRVGSFNFDKDGYLSDSGGGHIQGYMADPATGHLSTKLGDIRIITQNIRPVPTTKVRMNVNLDSRAELIEEEFNLAKPSETSNFANTINVFDSHGRSHAMTTFFRKIDTDDGIQWEWFATVDSKEVTDPSEFDDSIVGKGIVRFDNNGNLMEEETLEFDANFNKGAFPNQIIDMDFGQNLGEEGGNGVGASSSTASKAATVFHDQNGFESGNLKSLKIDTNGDIRAFFTNGIQKRLASIAIANFENKDGLQKAGKNQFYKTLESGPPKIGLPQSGGRGSIYASSLEESNVDLAGQFVQMILTQRGFQANSRTITTSDTMIEEIINLKR